MSYEIIVRIFADGAVIPVVLIGAYMLLFKVAKGHRFEIYSRVLIAGLTAYLLAKIASILYQPSLERPFELLGVQAGALFLNNPGFPSDHALFVTVITAAVWYATRNVRVTIALAILVACICIARVVALVHTPIDMLFGVIIGLIGAMWYIGAPKYLPKR